MCPARGDDFDASWPSTAAGSSTMGTCAAGYSGFPIRSCSITGVWASTVTSPCTRTCQYAFCGVADHMAELRCPALTGDDHADWPSTVAGISATGTCNAGWTGSPTRSCNINGQWSSTIASPCIRTWPLFLVFFLSHNGLQSARAPPRRRSMPRGAPPCPMTLPKAAACPASKERLFVSAACRARGRARSPTRALSSFAEPERMTMPRGRRRRRGRPSWKERAGPTLVDRQSARATLTARGATSQASVHVRFILVKIMQSENVLQ